MNDSKFPKGGWSNSRLTPGFSTLGSPFIFPSSSWTLWGQGDRFNPGPFLADAMQPHDLIWSTVRAKLLSMGMGNCKYKNSRWKWTLPHLFTHSCEATDFIGESKVGLELHPLKHYLKNCILKGVKLSWERLLWLPWCFLDSIKSQRNGNSSHCSKLHDQSCSVPKSLSRNSEQSPQRLLLPARSARTYKLLAQGKVLGHLCDPTAGLLTVGSAPCHTREQCRCSSCGRKHPHPALALMLSLPAEPHWCKSLMVSWANQFNELLQRSCSTESHFDANSLMEGFLSCPRLLFKPPDQSASHC